MTPDVSSLFAPQECDSPSHQREKRSHFRRISLLFLTRERPEDPHRLGSLDELVIRLAEIYS